MHYFDWTATTKPRSEAVIVANDLMTDSWGNPSSVHGAGDAVRKMVEDARRQVLRGLGFGREAPGQLFFTSGGTEANNLAILGAARAKTRRGRVMISHGEHASVDRCAAALEDEGFEVIRIPTVGGRLDLDMVRRYADGVAVASFMLVNNETGALYDVASAAKIIRSAKKDAFIHTDAVQAFMKIRFTPEMLGVNAVSVSAHKIGGLKGVGALYVDRESLKAKRMVPLMLGGGQEGHLRAGTENTVGICAFGAAVTASLADFSERTQRTADLRQFVLDSLEGSDIRPNIPEGKVQPGILSLTVPGIKSETVLNFLSREGYFVSAGSACSSHGHVGDSPLVAFGLSDADADSTVRISLCHLNTEDECGGLCDLLVRAAAELRGLR